MHCHPGSGNATNSIAGNACIATLGVAMPALLKRQKCIATPLQCGALPNGGDNAFVHCHLGGGNARIATEFKIERGVGSAMHLVHALPPPGGNVFCIFGDACIPTIESGNAFCIVTPC
jgi:hypothetical protein